MPQDLTVTTIVEALQDASRGQRPTGLGFALADSIRYFDPHHWDPLTQNASVFLSRPYLTAIEDAAVQGLRSRYALIFQNQVPIAAVAAQMVTIAATQLGRVSQPNSRARAIELLGQKMREQALQVVRRDLLVCGNLFSWGSHGVAFAQADPEVLWPAVAEALHRIQQCERSIRNTDYTLIKALPCSDSAGARALARFGYRPLQTDPEMVLELDESWKSYEDYLGCMNKKYRKAATQVIKSVEQAGCRVEPLEHLGAHADRLYELYRQVEQQADVRLASLTPQFLPALARNLGADRFRSTVIRRGEDILAFVTSVRDGDTLVGYYLGLDYAINAEIPLYFRLLHALVAEAIEGGCRRISFGRTALEAKARLGCKPVPVEIWIRHRVPVLNAAVQQLLKVVPHDEAPARNPFKDT